MMLDAARVAVLLTALSLPFSTAGTNVFMLAAVLFWALSAQWRLTARSISREPAAWLGCLLFGMLLLGTTWSLGTRAEAFDTALKYRELFLFGIVMSLFTEERWRHRLLWILFGAAVVLLGASYAIHFGLIETAQTYQRALQGAVVLKSSITHSFIMALLSFAALVVASRLQGWGRWLVLLVALLAAANVLIAIKGRTGYIILAVLLLWLAARRWSARGMVAGMLAAGIAVVAAYQFSPTFQARIDSTGGEAQARGGDPAYNSIAQRVHYWKRSLEMASAHPMAGIGTGGWAEAFRASAAGDHPFFRDRIHKHPHNEYLFLAAQLGIGGLILFIAMFAAAFVTGGTRPEPERTLARGVVIAFAVGCLFNDFLLDSTEGHLWAVLGGALFGAARQHSSRLAPAHARASASGL
ncbi:MAG TPA: O-antigen ligase family protein [Burkholderiales bacterium]|nr:O-antigen ligase family protein [Burkholderiales bacterium]